MQENENRQGAIIDRGKIIREESGGYVVSSYQNPQVVTRPMNVREYEGDPPIERKYTYATGDEVYFFMFPDGRGLILGKMER